MKQETDEEEVDKGTQDFLRHDTWVLYPDYASAQRGKAVIDGILTGAPERFENEDGECLVFHLTPTSEPSPGLTRSDDGTVRVQSMDNAVLQLRKGDAVSVLYTARHYVEADSIHLQI